MASSRLPCLQCVELSQLLLQLAEPLHLFLRFVKSWQSLFATRGNIAIALWLCFTHCNHLCNSQKHGDHFCHSRCHCSCFCNSCNHRDRLHDWWNHHNCFCNLRDHCDICRDHFCDLHCDWSSRAFKQLALQLNFQFILGSVIVIKLWNRSSNIIATELLTTPVWSSSWLNWVIHFIVALQWVPRSYLGDWLFEQISHSCALNCWPLGYILCFLGVLVHGGVGWRKKDMNGRLKDDGGLHLGLWS